VNFGRYRVTRTLGSGAMGDVYEAVDDVLGREVAIKTLKATGGITARVFDERFKLEARAIAQLSHPGVVQVFDIDLDAEQPFIVLERVAGPSLASKLEAGPLPPTEIAALGIQIARALAAAHAANIVHRDVKPSNILGAGPGAWKLADFGVAHVPDSSLTMTGQFVGSPAYASPEALVKGISAPAGDIYALGATLYQAAAGKWPRLEANGALLAPTPPLAELAPQLPAHIAAAIDRAVELEYAKRPTASELADLLAAASAPVAIPSRRRWQPYAVVGAIVLLILVIASSRGGKSGSPAATTAPQEQRDVDDPPPGAIRVDPPEGLEANTKATHDWDKVVDQLQDGHYGEAKRKLDDWEQRWGATPETKALHDQIDALPDNAPHGHGKHKH
jgi:eukaryotic-like serine/threonine-protein kinase